MIDSQGNVIEIQGITRNITEQKNARKKLLGYQKSLKSLASELLLSEEKERRRIAVDLHDLIGQSLIIAKMKLQMLKSNIKLPQNLQLLDQICESINQTIVNTKTLTFDMSSPILYELGLSEAIEELLTSEINGKHKINTSFKEDSNPKPLSKETSILLFRSVHELLLNVVLTKNSQMIVIKVTDDGCGFSSKKISPSPDRTGKFGIFTIKERLEYLGGYLQINSTPPKGTQITISAPLKS